MTETNPKRRRMPTGYRIARTLVDSRGIEAALDALASQIRGRNPEPGRLALIGVRRGGVHLAQRLARRLSTPGHEVPIGVVDITLYRDDLDRVGANPIVGPTEIPFEIEGITVVLVDDVLYTGRTIRAALDALLDYGRPRCVQLAVLVDRGHRELPIQADYVGQRIETRPDEQVEVLLVEEGGDDSAVLLERQPGAGGAGHA
ncbi:MAG: bifunctional pyr operon transcriptional regulator/uracil phosphoribosyltransferase PyrR [bacterium]